MFTLKAFLSSRDQGSKLKLANSQNASDFGNLRVRKISTSKRQRVRIIHVSQTFGENRSNVWTRSEANKTAFAELRARFLLATGQRYCTEALCQSFAFVCCCCSSWFWSYHFHYIRYFKGKEFAGGLTSLLVEKNLTSKTLQVH